MSGADQMERKTPRRSRWNRGFTMIELMIVVVLASILATIAIPYYQKLTARAYRAEMQGILSRLRMQLINTYQNTGVFPTPAGGTNSSWNPADPTTGTPAIGRPAAWNYTDPDWSSLPGADGPVRMRYQYSVTNSGTTLTLTVNGSFPGVGGLYTYSEIWNGANLASTPVEFPVF
jgi:prepilin-type N-terminal cleavage/methylation domain-containing protein